MSEPTSDALFGNDGTWSPEPLPDPQTGLGRDTWRDTPVLPPLPLPPIPDASTLREAIAAVLGDNTGAMAGSAVRDPVANADVPGVPKVEVPQAGVPQAGIPQAGVPQAEAPKAEVPKATASAPPGAAASAGVPTTGGPVTTEVGDRSSPRRPLISALIPPVPARPRRSTGLRYRPPMAGVSRESGPGIDLRRRIRREPGDRPSLSRSGTAAAAVLLAISSTIVLLAYYIVTGFLDFMSRLLP